MKLRSVFRGGVEVQTGLCRSGQIWAEKIGTIRTFFGNLQVKIAPTVRTKISSHEAQFLVDHAIFPYPHPNEQTADIIDVQKLRSSAGFSITFLGTSL